MKTLTRIALAVALVCGLALAVQAGQDKEVTLKGDIACAHCTLKVAGVKSCQDALQVTEPGGAKTVYFLAQNDILEKFGHNCQGKKAVTVTGVTSEKDGQKWIAASKIDVTKG